MSVTLGSSIISNTSDVSPRAMARFKQEVSAAFASMGYPGPPTSSSFQVPKKSLSQAASVRFSLLSPFSGSPSYATADPLDETRASAGEDSITVYDLEESSAAQKAQVGDKGYATLEFDADGAPRWVLTEMFPTYPEYGHECQDATGGTAVSGTKAVVTLDTETESKGNIFIHSSSAYTVTVAGSGTIDIWASVGLDCSAMTAAPCVVAAYLCENGTEISGTRRWASFTNVNDRFTIPLVTRVAADAEDYYSIEVILESGTGSVATIADGSSMMIRAPWPVGFSPTAPDTGLAVSYDMDNTADITVSDIGGPDPTEGTPNNNSTNPSGAGDYLEMSEVADEWINYPGGEFRSFLTDDDDWVTILLWLRPEEAISTFLRKTSDYWPPGSETGDHAEWRIGGAASSFKFWMDLSDASKSSVGTANVTSSAGAWSINTWYFIACKARLHDTSGWKLDLYISEDGAAWDSSLNNVLTGQPATRDNNSKLLVNVSTDPPITGASGAKDFGMCWFRMYQREISDTELAYHYNGGSGRPYPFS